MSAGTPISPQLTAVASLLQFVPASVSAEVAYNKREASLQPHCCICSLFVPVNDYHSSPSPAWHFSCFADYIHVNVHLTENLWLPI